MSSSKEDRSKSHDWKLRSVTTGERRALKKFFGTTGEIAERKFFEEVVWWWRPLGQILGPQARDIKMPSKTRRGMFPEYVFEEIQLSESTDGIHDLVDYWRSNELGIRLNAPDTHWPTVSFSSIKAVPGFLKGWREWAFGKLSQQKIDLRKSDSELVAEFREELKRLREDRADRIPMPTSGHNRKQSWFSPSAFTVIELIDRHYAFGEFIDNDKWANVRAAKRSFVAKFRA